MRRSLIWLTLVPFAAASVLVGHVIAYAISGTPAGDVHGYLAHAPQIVLILATLSLLGIATDARARRSSPVPLATLAVTAFVVQEHLERLIHTGHLPFLLTSPVLWLGVALQLPLALIVWQVARRLGDELAAEHRRDTPPALWWFALAAPAVPLGMACLRGRELAFRARASRYLLTSFLVARRGQPEETKESQMRRILVVAVALVAVALPTAAVAGTAAVNAKPVVIQIKAVDGKPVKGIKRPSVKKGRTVRFVIWTNVGTELHLHGYDIEKVPRKGKLTVIQFVAKVPGRFELELHHPDVLLAQLTVRP